MTVFDGDAGVFAQAPEPDTVDDAVIYFVRDLKMRMPLAPLVLTKLPIEISWRFKNVDEVETTDILGEVSPPYDHAELTSNAAATFIWTYLCGRQFKLRRDGGR